MSWMCQLRVSGKVMGVVAKPSSPVQHLNLALSHCPDVDEPCNRLTCKQGLGTSAGRDVMIDPGRTPQNQASCHGQNFTVYRLDSWNQ